MSSTKIIRSAKRKRDEFDSDLREEVRFFPFSAEQAWIQFLPRELRPASHIGIEVLPDVSGFLQKELAKKSKHLTRFKSFTPTSFKRRMMHLHSICEVAEMELEFGKPLDMARQVQDQARELYQKEQALEAHIRKLREAFHEDTFAPAMLKIKQTVEKI